MRFNVLLLLGSAALSAAHPGHEEAELKAALSARAFKSHARRSLDSCADKLEKRGVNARAQERRAATWAKHSKTKTLRRDLSTVLNTSHHSNRMFVLFLPLFFFFFLARLSSSGSWAC